MKLLVDIFSHAHYSHSTLKFKFFTHFCSRKKMSLFIYLLLPHMLQNVSLEFNLTAYVLENASPHQNMCDFLPARMDFVAGDLKEVHRRSYIFVPTKAIIIGGGRKVRKVTGRLIEKAMMKGLHGIASGYRLNNKCVFLKCSMDISSKSLFIPT